MTPRARPRSRSPPPRRAPSAAVARRAGGSAAISAPGLQERLAVGPPQVAQRLERPAVADRGQDVGQLAVLGPGVVDVVGHDDRQAELVGERRRLRDEPVVVGEQVVRELDEEAARRPARRRGRRASRSAPRRRARPARSPTRRRRASSPSRQPDSATRPSVCSASSAWLKRGTAFVPAMFARETSRHRLRQPTADRASSTRCGPRPRSPIPRRSSLTGSRWPGSRGTLGPRPRGHAVDDRGRARSAAARSGRRVRRRAPARRHRRSRPGSATAGSEQLDLQPDDRMQADGLGRPDEADRAVQPGMIGDGQPGQPQLDGPLDQVVRGRGAVEEREVGVAVEFGVRDGCHGSLRSMAGCMGAGQYRTSVLVRTTPGDDRDEGRVDIRGRRAFPWACDLPDRPSAGSSRSGSRPCLRSPAPLGRAARRRAPGPCRHRDPAPDHRHPAAEPRGLRLPAVLASRRGTVDRIHYDLVSTIAFFGLGHQVDGAIDRDWVGYKEYVGDAAAAVTNAAHDKGVRVVPPSSSSIRRPATRR